MRNLPTMRSGRRLPNASDFFSQFDNFFGDFEKDFFNKNSALSERSSDVFSDFSPAVDIEESNEMYLISADLPGLKENEVKIDLNDRTLRISGERRREVKNEENCYYERSHGRFTRSFTLPEAVDPKKIEAHFDQGVLRVALPKTEVSAPQEVKIQTGSPKGLLDRFLNREKVVEQKTSPEKAKQN